VLKKLYHSDFKLLVLYLLICGVILLRIKGEQTGYLSPDSRYYLEVSQNILDGKGPYITNVSYSPEGKPVSVQALYTTWPLGYPLLICLLSLLSGLNVFWASKLVNMLSMGAIILLLRSNYPKASFACTLLFCSFAMLENFSFTWSEGPFLLTVLLLCLALDRYFSKGAYKILFVIMASSVAMFFLRYVGFVSAMFTGGIAVYFLLSRKDHQRAFSLMVVSLLTIGFCFAYFYVNYLNTRSASGDSRLLQDWESSTQVVKMLLVGLFNTLFIFRNYYFQWPIDLYFIILGCFQLAILGWAYYKVIYKKISINFTVHDRFSLLLLLYGLIYLVVIVFLRVITYFDAFNYRILVPFSFPLSVALIIYLSMPERNINFKKLEFYLTCLLISSLLWNLPKQFLYEVWQNWIS
jgi:hypothetical protein